jgi:hypothetical protein
MMSWASRRRVLDGFIGVVEPKLEADEEEEAVDDIDDRLCRIGQGVGGTRRTLTLLVGGPALGDMLLPFGDTEADDCRVAMSI